MCCCCYCCFLTHFFFSYCSTAFWVSALAGHVGVKRDEKMSGSRPHKWKMTINDYPWSLEKERKEKREGWISVRGWMSLFSFYQQSEEERGEKVVHFHHVLLWKLHTAFIWAHIYYHHLHWTLSSCLFVSLLSVCCTNQVCVMLMHCTGTERKLRWFDFIDGCHGNTIG